MMFPLAFADLGGREEAFDEWVSSTPFFLSIPCDASRQTSNARALSKDGPEHQVLHTCNTFLAKLGRNPTYREHEDGLALYLNDDCCCGFV